MPIFKQLAEVEKPADPDRYNPLRSFTSRPSGSSTP